MLGTSHEGPRFACAHTRGETTNCRTHSVVSFSITMHETMGRDGKCRTGEFVGAERDGLSRPAPISCLLFVML